MAVNYSSPMNAEKTFRNKTSSSCHLPVILPSFIQKRCFHRHCGPFHPHSRKSLWIPMAKAKNQRAFILSNTSGSMASRLSHKMEKYDILMRVNHSPVRYQKILYLEIPHPQGIAFTKEQWFGVKQILQKKTSTYYAWDFWISGFFCSGSATPFSCQAKQEKEVSLRWSRNQ